MPRKKVQKKANEMTTDELAKRVFPPEVLEKLHQAAHAKDEEPKPQPKKSK